MIEILQFSTPDEVAAEAASRAARALATAQTAHAPAVFVLAGGRLPPQAGLLLAQKYNHALDWSQILFLIGDERCVPLDDPESSWQAFLPMFAAHPEVPAQHQLRPQSNKPAEQAAHSYNQTLRNLPVGASGKPIFTHLWLGMGEDGHTLSLFPKNPAITTLADELVVPVHNSPKPPVDRISLTYNALAGVQSAVVFITGISKAPILAQIANGDHSLPIVIASQTIHNAGGHVTWLIDHEAASQLPDTERLARSL